MLGLTKLSIAYLLHALLSALLTPLSHTTPQTSFGRYPTRHDLDAACPGNRSAASGDHDDTPVFLWRACWHIGVGNTAGKGGEERRGRLLIAYEGGV